MNYIKYEALNYTFDYETAGLTGRNILVGYTDGTTYSHSTGSVSTPINNALYGILGDEYARAENNHKSIGFLFVQEGVSTFNVYVSANYDYINYGIDYAKPVITGVHTAFNNATPPTTTTELNPRDYFCAGMNGSGYYVNGYPYNTTQSSVVYTSNNDKCNTYDFTSVLSDEIITHRRGFRFHNHFLQFDLEDYAEEYSFYVGLGQPYATIRQEGYDTGYSNGYADGYNTGYDTGYGEGFDLGQSGVDRSTATAFTYVSQAFNAVGGIMSLEVLPHITLGICFSIPLVIVLIMTIFKLVKK